MPGDKTTKLENKLKECLETYFKPCLPWCYTPFSRTQYFHFFNNHVQPITNKQNIEKAGTQHLLTKQNYGNKENPKFIKYTINIFEIIMHFIKNNKKTLKTWKNAKKNIFPEALKEIGNYPGLGNSDPESQTSSLIRYLEDEVKIDINDFFDKIEAFYKINQQNQTYTCEINENIYYKNSVSELLHGYLFDIIANASNQRAKYLEIQVIQDNGKLIMRLYDDGHDFKNMLRIPNNCIGYNDFLNLKKPLYPEFKRKGVGGKHIFLKIIDRALKNLIDKNMEKNNKNKENGVYFGYDKNNAKFVQFTFPINISSIELKNELDNAAEFYENRIYNTTIKNLKNYKNQSINVKKGMKMFFEKRRQKEENENNTNSFPKTDSILT